ncbi:hypothetical protein EBS02_07175, partial [bacterium]|nr:hypothetical protein [bacterium]
MNAQELYLDVTSGRFLDGESTIPTNKPQFYGNEVRATNIKLRKVYNNQLSVVTGSIGSYLKVRLGTPTEKLADGQIRAVSTLPLIKAAASITTIPAAQAFATGNISNYTPVTATITAGISSNSVVSQAAEFGCFVRTTASQALTLEASIQTITPVTATGRTQINIAALQTPTITAFISNSVVPTSSFNLPISTSESAINTALDLSISPQSQTSFTAILNTPIAASFTATITGGSVSTIGISNIGNGYLNGTYPLTFVGASTTSASANAVASGGKIVSVTIITGGSGYSFAPTVTFFTPYKSLLSISPANYIGKIDGKDSFTWLAPTSVSARADLLFSSPNSIESASVPSAYISFYAPSLNGNPTWQITIVSNGYGYSQAPTITRESVLVNSKTIKRYINTKYAKIETIVNHPRGYGNDSYSSGLLTVGFEETATTKPVSIDDSGIYFSFNPITKTYFSAAGLETKNYINNVSVTQSIVLSKQNSNPKHEIFSGRNDIYLAVVPNTVIQSNQNIPTRLALINVKTPSINTAYKVIVAQVNSPQDTAIEYYPYDKSGVKTPINGIVLELGTQTTVAGYSGAKGTTL